MFRVDLFVISLIIVTIVEIHMLIFDVCVSKHNSFFAHIFFFFKIVYITVGSQTVESQGYVHQYQNGKSST